MSGNVIYGSGRDWFNSAREFIGLCRYVGQTNQSGTDSRGPS